MKALDFFCGAGGLTKGLLDADIEVIAGIDNAPDCKSTYTWNCPRQSFINADLRTLGVETVLGLIDGIPKDQLLFAGCAPCQSFSSRRKSRHIRGDATILSVFANLIGAIKPRWVLMENVPGISKVPGFSTYRRFIRTLEQSDYKISQEILNAKHYGVPQSRRRLVLVACRHGDPSLPPKTTDGKQTPFTTVRDAIQHLPPVSAGESHPAIANHIANSISDLNLQRLDHTPINGGDRRSWPEHLVLECHKKAEGSNTDAYGRLSWEKPAPTLTGRCNSISNGRYGHPEQNRALTLREAACIQTFPETFEFFGTNNNIAQQIGNAVPVKFGYHIGKHIMRLNNSLENVDGRIS